MGGIQTLIAPNPKHPSYRISQDSNDRHLRTVMRPPAVSTQLRNSLQGFWATGLRLEPPTKVPDKVQPRFSAAVKPGKYRVKVWRDLARLVQPQLTASPVHQLQILVERHQQAATVSEPTSRAVIASLFADRLDAIGDSHPALGPCSACMSCADLEAAAVAD